MGPIFGGTSSSIRIGGDLNIREDRTSWGDLGPPYGPCNVDTIILEVRHLFITYMHFNNGDHMLSEGVKDIENPIYNFFCCYIGLKR